MPHSVLPAVLPHFAEHRNKLFVHRMVRTYRNITEAQHLYMSTKEQQRKFLLELRLQFVKLLEFTI
ncbi:hypothetical protein PR048_017026 [Dryococelus australis]|uniref:Uncharacterized protein n=1 Tax=Dryococelus australis TaxID=614101 RepID=A0ABQ9H8G7_9NEOP|nr:hypothetical protein PR048_017026 [Dryococelus australis]